MHRGSAATAGANNSCRCVRDAAVLCSAAQGVVGRRWRGGQARHGPRGPPRVSVGGWPAAGAVRSKVCVRSESRRQQAGPGPRPAGPPRVRVRTSTTTRSSRVVVVGAWVESGRPWRQAHRRDTAAPPLARPRRRAQAPGSKRPRRRRRPSVQVPALPSPALLHSKARSGGAETRAPGICVHACARSEAGRSRRESRGVRRSLARVWS
jgi:hypothetical protein